MKKKKTQQNRSKKTHAGTLDEKPQKPIHAKSLVKFNEWRVFAINNYIWFSFTYFLIKNFLSEPKWSQANGDVQVCALMTAVTFIRGTLIYDALKTIWPDEY